jgi:hypothetical protein
LQILRITIVILIFPISSWGLTPKEIFSHYDVGAGIQWLGLKPGFLLEGNDRLNFYYIGFSVGTNLNLIRLADNFTFGIDPNATILVDVFLNGGKTGIASFNLPVFATISYGAQANDKQHSGIGMSTGIGVQPGWYFGSDKKADFYGAFAFMAEIGFASEKSLWKIRYQSNLGDYRFNSGTEFSMKGIYFLLQKVI